MKQNKATQATIEPRMVDISKLYTPTAYKERKGCSRQYVYYMIERGLIKPENVIKINGAVLILEE